MSQLVLIEETDTEKIERLEGALEKHGRHSLYCCWVRKGGYYDKTLGCTCGLKEALSGQGNM